MTTANTIRSMYQHVSDAYAMIASRGGALPENKNLANLPAAIESIPSGGVIGYGTYGELQKAIRAGTAREKFPVGTEIPDTFYGENNPAIVMHYSKVLDKVGGEHDGAWLMFKYAPYANHKWSSSSYANSYLQSFLRTICSGFYDRCSDDLKSALQEFQIKCYDLVSKTYVTDTVHFCPPSASQLMGTAHLDEGEAWDYIKVLTGLSAPSNAANTGRIFMTRDVNGSTSVGNVWTRTLSSIEYALMSDATGKIASEKFSYGKSTLVSFALF